MWYLNRWRQKLFVQNTLNLGWNGSLNGQNPESGSFVGILKATGLPGKIDALKGSYSHSINNPNHLNQGVFLMLAEISIICLIIYFYFQNIVYTNPFTCIINRQRS